MEQGGQSDRHPEALRRGWSPRYGGGPQGEQAEQRPVRHFLGSLQPGMGSTKELPGALAAFRTQKTTPGPSECLPPRRPLLTPPSFCPGSWTRSPEPECDSRILPASPPTHPHPLPCLHLLLLPLCPLLGLSFRVSHPLSSPAAGARTSLNRDEGWREGSFEGKNRNTTCWELTPGEPGHLRAGWE